MGGESPNRGSTAAGAVFLSYASEDAAAAERLAESLRGAGIEVWFDRSELRGGEAWDRQIRKQIHDCALFIPVISAHSDARDEGYFRREWKLAVDRTHDMSERRAFLVPVVIDDTHERGASVPDRFHEVQWSRLPGGYSSPAFIERVWHLLSPELSHARSPSGPIKPAYQTVRAGAEAVDEHRGVVQVRKRSNGRWPALLLLAFAVVGGGAYLALNRFVLSKRSPPASTAILDKSIAVLPFVDMSEKHDQEYFSDGLSEELIDRLSHSNDLRVISRTSSFYFKGKQATVGEIASTLQVNHVLEGSVRKAGDALRITAQLIRASDGSHVWSQTYERTLSDIFKVQDEIAGTVAAAMKVALNEPRRVATAPANTEAYNLLLQGNYFLDRNTRPDTEKAVAYYQEAIALNPDYAPAWARLAAANANQAASGWILISEGVARARNALQRAVRIDPNFPDAHRQLGQLYRDFDWDWGAAQAEFARALDLDPSNAKAGLGMAMLRLYRGQFDEWIDLSRQQIARDPLDTGLLGLLAWMLFDAGRLEESVATGRKLLELNPSGASTRAILAFALLAMGQYAEALDASLKEPDEAWRLSVLPIVYWAMGRRAESDQTLHQLEEKYAAGSAYNIAEMYAYRGEADAAFRWLDRAYQQHDPGMAMSRIDPLLRNLHRDPRYQALLLKMKLTG
jgi:TolB-like protein